MKARFNTYDIICGVTELQKLIGMRVNQVYDIDNKTYLIRLQQSESKVVLLLESGIKFHTTAFEWPKNSAPSGFSMKLRKHLKNKRLENVTQVGIDRIVDFQFGTSEAAYHVILELYDRGNIILTDYEMTILNILRPHTEGEEVRFAVREKYPTTRARLLAEDLTEERIKEILETAQPGDNLRRVFTPFVACGPAVLDHVFLIKNLADCIIKPNELQIVEPTENKKGKKYKKKTISLNSRIFDLDTDLINLIQAFDEVDKILKCARTEVSKGYIIQKIDIRPSLNGGKEEEFYHNIEYHPKLFTQNKTQPYKEFETFLAAVDEFYSTMEGQKIDLKAMQQEKEALKKLSNVKKDHSKRIEELNKIQEVDREKADLITKNKDLVDNAILAIHSALANQISWPDIHELVKAAQLNGDPVANSIKQLKLETNHISVRLNDPYESQYEDDGEEIGKPTYTIVDVDLSLSAFANARKYYDQKRSAAKKEQRTLDASHKALKSAEKKTQQTLKEVRTISTISKARKVYWFEKFYWFISSENFLVIGGRDSQQNELIVKRYMRANDIYVHAEIQGATSVVIRNPTENEVPPKTLLEAGTMAISYSVAWDAKIVTNAYWVKSNQVSKTAPSGEYLGTGSFMIRGKKHFLPHCHLIMGLSLLFKLEDSSIERHRGERRVRTFDDDVSDKISEFSLDTENDKVESVVEEEINLDDSDNDCNEKVNNNLDTISEEEIEKDEQEEENSNSENEKDLFPDTHIKIERIGGNVIIEDNKESKILSDNLIEDTGEDDNTYIIPAMPTRIKQTKKSSKKSVKNKTEEIVQKINEVTNESGKTKRRQKGKLKKIKLKYKDQDEEERQLRMDILKSAGTNKTTELKKTEIKEIEKDKKLVRKPQEPKQITEIEDDDIVANVDVDMIDSLTGNPVNEDELLFAVPVVAPYQALQNYKYKVKLTPGSGKRGKAAKTTLIIFAKDKLCTSREKDLLKGIKDEFLARNIPGKVKLSAPQLQKFKK